MVAFNLPRMVTASGIALLLGIAVVLVSTLATVPERTGYLVIYVIVLTVALAASAVMLPAQDRAHFGWFLGSALSALFFVTYVVSRLVSRTGAPPAQTGWDYAPGTAALGCAALFLTLHASILLGANVAHPRRQDWND